MVWFNAQRVAVDSSDEEDYDEDEYDDDEEEYGDSDEEDEEEDYDDDEDDDEDDYGDSDDDDDEDEDDYGDSDEEDEDDYGDSDDDEDDEDFEFRDEHDIENGLIDDESDKMVVTDKQKFILLTVCCCCLVIIAAVLLGVLLGGGKGDETPEPLNAATTIAPSASPMPSNSPSEAPTVDINATEFPSMQPSLSPSISYSPTLSMSPSFTPSTSVMPTDTPGAEFILVIADTYISESAEAFGTSETLEVRGGDNVADILLEFDLTSLPPDDTIFGRDSKVELRLTHVESLAANPASIIISRITFNETFDVESLTGDDIDLMEGEVGPSFQVAEDTEETFIDISELIDVPEIDLRGRRWLQEEKLFLVLSTDDPVGQLFRSREAGDALAPTLIHTYIAETADEITSCFPSPCGALADCFIYNNGDIECECPDTTVVPFFEPCPPSTIVCPEGKIYSLAERDCVCPIGEVEDGNQVCYPLNSPCLDTPCEGIGALCNDDSTSGDFECTCSDNSIVGITDDCDFSTIVSCIRPFPCGSNSICQEEELDDGSIRYFCTCNDVEINFGEACVIEQ